MITPPCCAISWNVTLKSPQLFCRASWNEQFPKPMCCSYAIGHSYLRAMAAALGIPDLTLDSAKLLCIVETKIDPALDLTPAQRKGYLQCFGKPVEQHFSLLVPNNWKYGKSVIDVQRALAGKDVSVHLCQWRTLVSKLEYVAREIGDDEILAEAINFWKEKFGLIHLTDEEQVTLRTWNRECYSAGRKLERTIDQTKRLFDARGFETELEASELDGYGFYIKRGKLYVLWTGIWTKAPYPLCFGYRFEDRAWLPPLGHPEAPTLVDQHYLWALEQCAWDDPEFAFTRVSEALKSFPSE